MYDILAVDMHLNTIANLVPIRNVQQRNEIYTAADLSARYSTFFTGTQ